MLESTTDTLLPDFTKDKVIVILKNHYLLDEKNLQKIEQSKSCVETPAEYFSRLYSLLDNLSSFGILNQANLNILFDNIEYVIKTTQVWITKSNAYLESSDESENLNFFNIQKEFEDFFRKSDDTKNSLFLLNIAYKDGSKKTSLYQNSLNSFLILEYLEKIEYYPIIKKILDLLLTIPNLLDYFFISSTITNAEKGDDIYSALLDLKQLEFLPLESYKEIFEDLDNLKLTLNTIHIRHENIKNYLFKIKDSESRNDISALRDLHQALLNLDKNNIASLNWLIYDKVIQNDFKTAANYISRIRQIFWERNEFKLCGMWDTITNLIEYYDKKDLCLMSLELNSTTSNISFYIEKFPAILPLYNLLISYYNSAIASQQLPSNVSTNSSSPPSTSGATPFWQDPQTTSGIKRRPETPTEELQQQTNNTLGNN